MRMDFRIGSFRQSAGKNRSAVTIRWIANNPAPTRGAGSYYGQRYPPFLDSRAGKAIKNVAISRIISDIMPRLILFQYKSAHALTILT